MKKLRVLAWILCLTLLQETYGVCRPGFRPKKPTTSPPEDTVDDFDEPTVTATPTVTKVSSIKTPTVWLTTTSIADNSANTETSGTTEPTFAAIPTAVYDVNENVRTLRHALNSTKVNSTRIIRLLTSKDRNRRFEMINRYQIVFQKNLIEELNAKLSGNIRRLATALVTPLTEYYAKELFGAMHGSGTDESCLIDILSILDNQEMAILRTTYEQIFAETLEECIKGDTSGDFRELLIALMKTNRESTFNQSEAIADAKKLHRAGELRWGTDESVFIRILTTRSYDQLKYTFDEYEWLTGHSLEYAIKSEFSSDVKRGLLAIVSSIRNRSKYFAERLHSSMGMFRRNDAQLIRIFSMMNSFELENAKRYYQEIYGIGLKEAIEEATAGDYKACLVQLLQAHVVF